MSAPLKHLIDPAPLPDSGQPPQPLCCRVVDALAGDCTSPLGERLRRVDAECGFGTRCSRGCAELPPPTCGFAGAGRVSASRVIDPADPVDAGNAERF